MMSSKYTRQRDHRRPCRTRIHQSLKCGRCVAESKRHDFKLEQSGMGRESGLTSGFRWQGHLLVLHRRQIQPAVIHTERGSAVFLSHQHHRCRPRTVARFDLSTGQHFFNTAFLLFNLLRRHTSWAHRMGGVSPVSMVCSTASVCPVRAEPGMGEEVHKFH